MEPVLLARIQFYLTAGFHFVFIPINIGLSWYIVWFMLKYLRTKDIYYKNVSRFWIKLFGVTVAIGVPTGIILEFQFGTNWAEFARFTGAIFGIVLALEVLFSFFLESVFLYVLLQGWNTKRITDKILFLSSIIMAIGATLSAFFILAANSWMHTPAGYTIVNERVEVVDFLAATFNPSTVPRFLHTFNACLITASFFIIGISSWYLLKGKHIRFATESIKTALTVGLVSTIAQPLLGHLQAIIVAKNEPATLAAQEGLFNTQSGAPLTVIGIVTNKGVVFKIGIPHLLSLMVNFNPNSVVPGLDAFPVSDRPPVMICFYSFHAMIYLAGIFILVTLMGILLLRNKKIPIQNRKRYLKIALLASPLPILANQVGWITTEVGRQPWIVYNLFRTAEAASIPVSLEQLVFSLTMFSLIYIILFAAWAIVVTRLIGNGPNIVDDDIIKEAGT